MLLLALGACLAVMNSAFYLALDRLPIALVAAIEFIGTIGIALWGLRTGRNTLALVLAVAGVALLIDIPALLAADGFSGPAAPLSGERGFLRVYADPPNLGGLTARLGVHWEIGRNTYKPYPCGIVLNPVIDAALALAARDGFDAAKVAGVEVWGHPLLRQRTDRPDVSTGREAQVSAQHAVAAAFRLGRADLDAFSDAAVARTLAEGRPPIRFHDDAAMDIAATRMTVEMTDGARHEIAIDAARGSEANPLTDRDIEAKLEMLSARAGFKKPVQSLIDAVWGLDDLADAADVVRLAAA